jgi:anti-anti-sigma factor
MESALRATRAGALGSCDADLLSLDSARQGDVQHLSIYGELDAATAGLFDRELRRVQDSDIPTIIIDLSALEFIDSSGLRVLARADERSRANGNALRFLRATDLVHRAFVMTGLDSRLSFLD